MPFLSWKKIYFPPLMLNYVLSQFKFYFGPLICNLILVVFFK